MFPEADFQHQCALVGSAVGGKGRRVCVCVCVCVLLSVIMRDAPNQDTYLHVNIKNCVFLIQVKKLKD